MKILYIAGVNPELAGVVKKLTTKIEVLSRLEGVEVSGYFLMSEQRKNKLLSSDIPIGNITVRSFAPPNDGLFERIPFLWKRAYRKRRFRRLKTLKQILQNEPYDFAIIRYMMGSAALLDAIKGNGHRIVFEHNSIEEHELEGKLNGKSDKWGLYDLENEKKYGPIILSKCAGVVGVTDEITSYQMNRSGKNGVTISNGFDVDSVKQRTYRLSGDTCRFIFLAGSSNQWHGIDRIINGLKEYQGEKKVNLRIIGKTLDSIQELANEVLSRNVTVEFLPLMHGEELNEVFDNADIAFGSLGMHRIGLKQASVLKVREYMSRGIPFVLGYDDPDVEEDFPYAFRVPADESYVDIDKIVGFAEKCKLDVNHPDRIRKLARDKVHYEMKMKSLVSFVSSLR